MGLVDRGPVDERCGALRRCERDGVARLSQSLHRLHQLIEVEAGLEDLAVLQVETVGIGQDDEDVSCMRANGTEPQCKGDDETAQSFIGVAPDVWKSCCDEEDGG